MSREIIEAVRTIEQEKGIEGDTLIRALEDALLAAYKKTTGAARHATVELDDEGEFRVYSIEIPADLEEPEIADGLVEIRGVAREPGYRSKIAVESHAQGVDPVGACVGPRGSRVRMVVSELRGERIEEAIPVPGADGDSADGDAAADEATPEPAATEGEAG